MVVMVIAVYVMVWLVSFFLLLAVSRYLSLSKCHPLAEVSVRMRRAEPGLLCFPRRWSLDYFLDRCLSAVGAGQRRRRRRLPPFCCSTAANYYYVRTCGLTLSGTDR